MDADLVLEGGGVKGIALVGAYTALSEAGYNVHRIAGTSAGAIVGALIAAGMTSGDLKRVMREIDYGRFEDKGFLDHLGLVGKGASLLFEKGIYEGSYLRAFMNDQLNALGVETFADLRIDDPGASPTDAKAYRLVVMTSDVTRARLVRLPWDYEQYGLDPDEQRVADAVRASMSIPFFYEPVRLTDRDGQDFGARRRRGAVELPDRRLRPAPGHPAVADIRPEAVRASRQPNGAVSGPRRHSA